MRVASRTMPMRARVVASSRVIRTVWRAVAAPRRAETLSVANNALDIVRVRGCGRSRAGASRVNRHPVAKPYPNPTLSVLNVILVDGARPAPVLQRHRASRRRSSHARVASYFYFHPRASPKSSWLAWMRASMVRAAGDVAQKTDG
jgi:hypothetical protein